MLQNSVLLAMLFGDAYAAFLLLAALGHATFLAAMAGYAPLVPRAHSVSIFRFWRDSGYAIGALLTGGLADAFGLEAVLAMQGRMCCLPIAADASAATSCCVRPALR